MGNLSSRSDVVTGPAKISEAIDLAIEGLLAENLLTKQECLRMVLITLGVDINQLMAVLAIEGLTAARRKVPDEDL